MVSPSSRQAEMSKKSTSSLLERTRLTASPKEQTGIPSLVNLSSGSLVRLPANTTRLKLTTANPPYLDPASLTIQEHARFSSDETLAGRAASGGIESLTGPRDARVLAPDSIRPGECPLQGVFQSVVAPEKLPGYYEAGSAEDAEFPGPGGPV